MRLLSSFQQNVPCDCTKCCCVELRGANVFMGGPEKFSCIINVSLWYLTILPFQSDFLRYICVCVCVALFVIVVHCMACCKLTTSQQDEK